MKDLAAIKNFAQLYPETFFVLNCEGRRDRTIGFRFPPVQEYDIVISQIKRALEHENLTFELEQLTVNKTYRSCVETPSKKVYDRKLRTIYVILRPSGKTFELLCKKFEAAEYHSVTRLQEVL